jgi:ATP-binding protein involved in chromosome partitioning
VDELSGEKTLDSNTIPKDIRPEKSEYVGNYALRVYWSDKHDTGIFHYKMLRDFENSA